MQSSGGAKDEKYLQTLNDFEQVQKETPEGMVDGVCDEASPKGYAGYCK